MTPTIESYVYFVQAVNGGPVKIGVARDVKKRLLGIQNGNPSELVVRNALPGDRVEEGALHMHFTRHRLKGEWFEPVPELLELLDATEWPAWLMAVRRSSERIERQVALAPSRDEVREQKRLEQRFRATKQAERLYHRERAARGLRSTPKPL